ncbi:MAG: RNA polymerase subunit sigma-70, partial [Candidatus Abyssubacteria bacterium]|nr:RNA polymerase subunit sigma-70 [Candidatus Abyssubacteria bacterium]
MESIQQLEQWMKPVIEKGSKKGVLTYDELNDLLPDDIISPEGIDSILSMLDARGINLVDDAESSPHDEFEEEHGGHTRSTKRDDVEERPSKIDDPVRMYL